MCRHEGQKRVQIGNELNPLGLGGIPYRPVNGRRGSRRGCACELRQRRKLIARLHRLKCCDIVGAKELRARQRPHEFGFSHENLGDPGRYNTLPAWAHE